MSGRYTRPIVVWSMDVCNHCVWLLLLLFAGTRSRWREDKAKDPLFTFVRPEVLQRPTIKNFIRLLDNYETSTGEMLQYWRFDWIFCCNTRKKSINLEKVSIQGSWVRKNTADEKPSYICTNRKRSSDRTFSKLVELSPMLQQKAPSNFHCHIHGWGNEWMPYYWYDVL